MCGWHFLYLAQVKMETLLFEVNEFLIIFLHPLNLIMALIQLLTFSVRALMETSIA